jgi:hypothetical protein
MIYGVEAAIDGIFTGHWVRNVIWLVGGLFEVKGMENCDKK